MQGGVENYLAQNDSNNEYKLMFGRLPNHKFISWEILVYLQNTISKRTVVTFNKINLKNE